MLTTEDVLVSSLAACSIMFRRAVIRNFPEWFLSGRLGDWPLQVFASEHGPIGYLDHEMAVYPVTPSGASHGLSPAQQLVTKVGAYDRLNEHLCFRYDRLIRDLISQYCYRLALLHAKDGDWRRARLCHEVGTRATAGISSDFFEAAAKRGPSTAGAERQGADRLERRPLKTQSGDGW